MTLKRSWRLLQHLVHALHVCIAKRRCRSSHHVPCPAAGAEGGALQEGGGGWSVESLQAQSGDAAPGAHPTRLSHRGASAHGRLCMSVALTPSFERSMG